MANSTGSACHVGSIRLSPVLEAMGIPPNTGVVQSVLAWAVRQAQRRLKQ
jgi:cysteine sulfinate desulfinase/cysteine desulfurase-like protein